jgi:hypothetical protein
MTLPPAPPVLDYQTQPLKYVEDAEDWKWRRRRLLLRAVIVLPFLPIVFYFVPNFFVLGRFTRPKTADFVAYAQTRVVPVIQGLKKYQRDTGHMPRSNDEMDDFRSKYLPPSISINGYVENGVYRQFGPYFEETTYNFTPGAEGFAVRGRYVNGPLPLPPVSMPVSTQPSSTQP